MNNTEQLAWDAESLHRFSVIYKAQLLWCTDHSRAEPFLRVRCVTLTHHVHLVHLASCEITLIIYTETYV